MDELNRLIEVLRRGQAMSGQGSYARRAPAERALPHLTEARAGLKAFVRVHAGDVEAWRLLAQAEEALLNYPAARAALEKAVQLMDHHDRRDLKKLALLREYEAQWADLLLTPRQLKQLGEYLSTQLAVTPCDHSLRQTEEWLASNGIKHARRVISGLQQQGGFCDCEILANVAE